MQYYHDEESRYKKVLLITQVFPKSLVGKIHVIKEGSIIEKINNKPIKTIDTFRKQVLNIIKKKEKNIVIETNEGLKVVLNIKDCIKDDLRILDTYKIPKSKFFEVIEKKI